MELKDITTFLDNSGLKYVVDNNLVKLYWMVEDKHQLEIVIFFNELRDNIIVITVLSQINNDKANAIDILEYLLRLNYITQGVKFSINKEKLIFCSTELSLEIINPELLKNTILKIIDVSKLFLNTIEDLEKLKSDKL